jgi:predicted transcriptional regulator
LPKEAKARVTYLVHVCNTNYLSLRIESSHVNAKKLNNLSRSHASYRDRIYIIKDIILKPVYYGELNQTAFLSLCGLNMKKHKPILDDLESKDLIDRNEVPLGKRTVSVSKSTGKGIEFCRSILEPYEKMFPRVVAVRRGLIAIILQH